jgi:hypothetical protein
MGDIERQLEVARSRAENYGQLYGNKETADDYLKVTYAQLYEDAPNGTVGERDAWVKRQIAYKEAIERKENAYADWKAAETYMKLLLAEVEVWRSQQANNRYMDRAHQ